MFDVHVESSTYFDNKMKKLPRIDEDSTDDIVDETDIDRTEVNQL